MKQIASLAALALALTACSGADEPVAASGDPHGDGLHAMASDGPMAALPDDGITPVVEISDAWIRPHPQGRDVTAAYFSARLTDGQADRLLSARIDGAERVEMHGHSMNEQGMMRMRPIGPQDLMGGDRMVFAPRGNHLMVHGLAPVFEGDQVTGVLVFERAGEVPAEFSVQAMPPGSVSED
jgi:periplasmic copper chaperone A